MNVARQIVAVVVACACFAPHTAAQYSKARSQMERVQRVGETLSGLIGNRANEEPRIFATAREMIEACKAAAEALSSIGESLANAASGEHEVRLREPQKLARNLAYQLGDRELIDKCNALMRLVNLDGPDRGNDFSSRMEAAMTSIVVAARGRANDWAELSRKSEETLRWLRESLQAAQAMRDNSARPGMAMNAAKVQIETKRSEQGAEMRRIYESLRECEAREADAARKCREAVVAHDAARMAPPSSSYTANAAAAYQRWKAAEKEHKEIARRGFDLYVALERAVAEGKARLTELARLMADIERFAEDANPETIAKRWTDFERWTKLLEQDLSR